MATWVLLLLLLLLLLREIRKYIIWVYCLTTAMGKRTLAQSIVKLSRKTIIRGSSAGKLINVLKLVPTFPVRECSLLNNIIRRSSVRL